LRITDVEAIVLRQPAVDGHIADGSQDDLLVFVHTDEGITGIGEVDSAPEIVKAAIDAPASHSNAAGLRSVLVGQDPLDIDELWQRMYRASIYYGRRGVALHAMSGIEIALWDLKGKVLGRPVSALLGTPQRGRVRAYASALMPESIQDVRTLVGRLVHDEGFTAVKLGWGSIGRDIHDDIRRAQTARETAGADVAIMIDAGFGYGTDAARAITVARELEPLDVAWLEEPFEPDAFEAYARLADSVDLPIACGEQDTTWWGFRDVIERAHVDIVQPDVTRCGGLSEALRIAEFARSRGVICVPHAWKSGVIKAASLHLNSVLPEARFQEYCVSNTPINNELTQQRFPLTDGFAAVPTGPGLGVDLDMDVVDRLSVSPRNSVVV
jgi:L-rhamnonate dehydratase